MAILLKTAPFKDLRNRQAAFTLLEAVITLGLVCALLLIPTNDYHEQLVDQQEQLALARFEYNWHTALKTVFITKHSCMILLDNQAHRIYFRSLGLPNHQEMVQDFPQSVTFEFDTNHGRALSLELTSEAMVSPATIVFFTKNKKYIYKIQMGWGQLIAT